MKTHVAKRADESPPWAADSEVLACWPFILAAIMATKLMEDSDEE